MQLITILLIAVAILVVLSGLSVYVGSRKVDKTNSRFFFVATIFGALWAISIATFLLLQPGQEDFAPVALLGVYSSALFLDTCLVGHTGWSYKVGKVFTALFALFSLLITGTLVANPGILYSDIILSTEGNAILIENDWFYWVYMLFFTAITFVLLGLLLYRISKTSNKGHRFGLTLFFIGLSFTGTVSLVFDLLLPFWVRYDLIWVGPLTMAASIITYYYAILRYKVISLDATWLKILSYVIIMAAAAVVYMLIFFIIFTALFKVPNPSASIFALNFIMIIIVLLLMPVVNELSAFVRSLIQTNQVDLAYIIKKMNKMATQDVDLNELSDFLADHLHFSYIGLLVNKKLYGSSALPITADELKQVTLLKSPEKGGIWQDFNEPVAVVFNRLNINAVAELRDAKGKKFGQILVGKPQGKMGFDRRDLIQLEMIVNLVAAMIDTKAK